MGVSYSPERGIERIDHSCGAKRGYHVRAYDVDYVVIEIDDYGCYVCAPLDGLSDPDNYDYHTLRTFDDLDIDFAHPPVCGYGEGI